MIPSTSAEWRLRGKKGLDSLEFETTVPMPQLGPSDVLVKLEAASLNYRDVLLTQVNNPQPLPVTFM